MQTHRPIRGRFAAVVLVAGSVLAGMSLATLPASAASASKAPADLLKSVPSPFVPSAVQPPNSYVGKLVGNPSGLAAIVRGGAVLFYWCDGLAAGDWFGGTNTNGTLEATSAKGIVVKAKLVSGKIAGTLSRGGKTHTFSLALTAKGTGLFRAADPPGGKPGSVLGWIALKDALVGATNEPDGSVSDAVPMSLSTFGGGCFRVRRAIKLMANNGGSPGTILDMKIDGQSAGCRTQDLGLAAT